MNCFFDKFIERELVKVTDEDIKRLEENIKNIIVFCLVWSIGCSTNYEGRGQFNEKLKFMLAQNGFSLMPKSYYEYFYN